MQPVWPEPSSAAADLTAQVWIIAGVPGFAGADKAARAALLSARFGADGWRLAHVVRGQVVPPEEAILEYEDAYRHHLRAHPALVELLVTEFGNVYDWAPDNVHDHDYQQPHTAMNHYQDISVRRVIAELAHDPAWPKVTPTGTEPADLLDLASGDVLRLPRAEGFRGSRLLPIRDPQSAGFVLNPAVVPVHDPALLTSLPGRQEWYHQEGCAHLSVEAFWQMSKVVEVRYDRFLAAPEAVRPNPLGTPEA